MVNSTSMVSSTSINIHSASDRSPQSSEGNEQLAQLNGRNVRTLSECLSDERRALACDQSTCKIIPIACLGAIIFSAVIIAAWKLRHGA